MWSHVAYIGDDHDRADLNEEKLGKNACSTKRHNGCQGNAADEREHLKSCCRHFFLSSELADSQLLLSLPFDGHSVELPDSVTVVPDKVRWCQQDESKRDVLARLIDVHALIPLVQANHAADCQEQEAPVDENVGSLRDHSFVDSAQVIPHWVASRTVILEQDCQVCDCCQNDKEADDRAYVTDRVRCREAHLLEVNIDWWCQFRSKPSLCHLLSLKVPESELLLQTV